MRKINKKGGMVTNLIAGIGGLIVLTVLLFVVISTLLGANVIDDVTSTKTVTAETGVWLNATTYTVDNSGADNFKSLVITSANNYTDGTAIAVANFTVSGTGFTNSSAATWANVSINYTYISTDLNYSGSATLMSSNMTSGIDNVSSKIPTILLIAAVVLLFGVIVLLVRKATDMGIGAGGASL